MNNILAILEQFETISLDGMDKVKLLDRMDSKYMFHYSKLPEILESLKLDYRVLSIEGKKCGSYNTRYFDTPDLKLYTQHHNGKLNRNKVRFREYMDSGLHFFEIKFKSNKRRTIKKRIRQFEANQLIEGESAAFLKSVTGMESTELQQTLQVFYNRITLVQNNLKERLTIDLALDFHTADKKQSFPQLVIAEVKQERFGKSPFTLLMNQHSLSPISISKYCLGVASLYSNVVKINNFKPKLLHVKKLCESIPV
ncbi:MAG: polyphosphate polymerase domain-containing protein [Bacteroidetes bacterium]|nr:polyphosphate polymerase domain-containing protein [Bacteroidota bacterium]